MPRRRSRGRCSGRGGAGRGRRSGRRARGGGGCRWRRRSATRRGWRRSPGVTALRGRLPATGPVGGYGGRVRRPARLTPAAVEAVGGGGSVRGPRQSVLVTPLRGAPLSVVSAPCLAALGAAAAVGVAATLTVFGRGTLGRGRLQSQRDHHVV